MKSYAALVLIFALLLLAAPALAFNGSSSLKKDDVPSEADISKSAKENDADYIRVFRSEDESVEQLEMARYLYGAVCAEISPEYDDEAIKAQAVACHSYALYMKQANTGSGDSALSGADLSDSPKLHQGYVSDDELKEKWGGKYDEYSEKIKRCVDEVADYVMTYDGKTVIAAFHSINDGRTENSGVLWGEDLPYLKSVESPGDLLSPDRIKTLEFSADEMKTALAKNGIELSGDARSWFGKSESSDAGTVLSIEICGNKVSGTALRSALCLASCDFSVSFDGEKFTVETRGCGHMIGMSQYGAEYMARQGFSWQEILKKYYSGVEIEKI